MVEKYSEAWDRGADISAGYIMENTHQDLIRAIEVWGEAWAIEDEDDVEKARLMVQHLWRDLEVALEGFEEASTQAGYEKGYDEGLKDATSNA